MNIDQIISLGECGYIEYKRQWYWNLSSSQDVNISQNEYKYAWEEFIKDFLALVNANEDSFGNERFLVIGFDEKEERCYDFSLNEDLFYKIKEKIRDKVKKFITDASKIKYRIVLEKKDDIDIILISIEQPNKIHSLSKNIHTKTIEYAKNTVLYRENNSNINNKDDKVSVMPENKIISLGEKFSLNNSATQPKKRRKKSIRLTIDSFLESNDSYSLSKGFPKVNDDADKYYELYELTSNVDDNKTYFLYISDNSMESTIKRFKEDFSHYADKQLIILIDKPTKGIQPQVRKSNIESYVKKVRLFNYKIYFIDEFGKKHLYKKYLEPFLFNREFPNTDNFIDNNVIDKLNNEEDLKASKVIEDWFQEEDNPIIVLTGIGGIGKTTLTKYFLNTTLKKQEQDNYVLFLDSSTIIDKLQKTNINSIYDLYKADLDDSRQLTEKLFKLSIDNGSFTIVLDGLDEIISRMKENFQLYNFLNKINTDYCFNSAKTKIIITCRDSIWDESLSILEKQKLNVKNILLKPFDEEQAKEFFKSCFKSEKLQKKGLSIVEKLIGESNDKTYSPFILDTVRSIIFDKNDVNIGDLFSQDKSEMTDLCLSTSNQTDYLIYAVCKRESKKLEIPFEKQIKLLCNMCKYNGLTELKFIELSEEILNKKLTDQDLSLLKAHPFIFSHNKIIDLRYDFLRDFFTVILIAQKLTNVDSILDNSVLSLLDKKVSYLNKFSIDVAKRVSTRNIDDICISIIENIEDITIKKEENFDRFISSLFLIYLAILSEFNRLKNNDDLQKALVTIFSTNENCIKNLCLCGINKPNKKPKLIFDFSNLKIYDFYIKNYSEFYNCIFDDNTLFSSGEIDLSNIPVPNIRHSLKKSYFSKDISFLGNTKNILDDIDTQNDIKFEDQENNFKKFIKYFYSNGRFRSKKVAEIKSKQGNMVTKMLNIGVIELDKDSKLNEDEYRITPAYANDLAQYLDSSIKLPKIIELLKNISS